MFVKAFFKERGQKKIDFRFLFPRIPCTYTFSNTMHFSKMMEKIYFLLPFVGEINGTLRLLEAIAIIAMTGCIK